jgi:hypothetical protein
LTVYFRGHGPISCALAGGLVAVLPAVGKGAQGVDQVAHGGEGSAADGLLGDDAEGDLNELEPRVGLICRLPFRGTV